MAYILLSLLSLATVGMNEISGTRFEDENSDCFGRLWISKMEKSFTSERKSL